MHLSGVKRRLSRLTRARARCYAGGMRTNLWSGILVVVLALAIAGCGKKEEGEGAGGGRVARPPKPADGTPLVAVFVELGKDKRGEVEAHFDLFSYADKDVAGYQGTFHYLDASGKELGTFPWSQQAPKLVSKGGRTAIAGGFKIPPETKTVSLTIDTVMFTDGTKWEAPASAAATPAAP